MPSSDITHIAATESGASIIAADAEHVSIIVRSNGSYITHTIDYSPLQLVGSGCRKKLSGDCGNSPTD